MNDAEGAVQVVLQSAVAAAPLVIAHPMINTMSLAVSSGDVLRFLKETGHDPQILDLTAYSRVAA